MQLLYLEVFVCSRSTHIVNDGYLDIFGSFSRPEQYHSFATLEVLSMESRFVNCSVFNLQKYCYKKNYFFSHIYSLQKYYFQKYEILLFEA